LRPVFPDFLSDSVAAADTERSMILLGSTSPRMTPWAHDAAARVARPVKRRAAVATRDAGNAAAQAIAVPIFWSRVARLSAVRHGAHCLECVVQGSMAVPRSSLSRCSRLAGPKAWGGLS
jgi:hypothetical protein